MGFLVAISGNSSTIVAVAADTANGANSTGAAYVYTMPATGWTTTSSFTAKLTPSDNGGEPRGPGGNGLDGEGLNSALALSGDGKTIIVGAVAVTVDSVAGAGAAYVFIKPLNGWANSTETVKVTASGDISNQIHPFFGYSIATNSNGTVTVFGAPDTTIDGNIYQGAAYLFVGSAASPTASLSPGSLSFSGPAGITTGPQTVTLTNTGTAPLNITSVAASASFTSSQNCLAAPPLAPGSQCSESVSFAPSSVGSFTGTLTFTDDSGGTPGATQSVQLSGTASQASTSTAITSVSPNPALVGQPVAIAFSVTPPAGDTLIPSGTVTIQASTGENCSGSAPSGSCSLIFASPVTRTITAVYSGDSNFTGSSSSSVSETVVDYVLLAFPSSQTTNGGKSVTYTVFVIALNGFSGTVSLSCGGGPPGATCAMAPTSVALSGLAAIATATVSVPEEGHLGYIHDDLHRFFGKCDSHLLSGSNR